MDALAASFEILTEPPPMRLTTLPYGKPREIHPNSDVESLRFSSQGLSLRLALGLGPQDMVDGLDISFADVSAFRYLDELHLQRYWSLNGLVRGYPVLEVQQGGWLDEEVALQQRHFHQREWLVVTGNGCVSVFAASAPEVLPVQWPIG
ncbi:hypothetical protein [Comamonas sp. MYb396]|uniref:hypothetical protein n=1 Tax=Comamonas sp. MYb396 TaxID=2745302 RepID=UPI00309CE0DF